LNADNGPVNIESGAVVDVSGAKEDNTKYSSVQNTLTDPNDIGVNAGLISIYSPNASTTLEGTLNGAAGYWKSYNGSSVTYGTGGSFVLDAQDLSDNSAPDKGFSSLNTILKNGGFTQEIDITLRGTTTPGQTLTIGDTIVANNFNLTADNWAIDFSGTIDSSSVGGGGTIQFNSGGNLTLEAASKIISPGATVFLNSADSAPGQTGYLSFAGTIDVTGGSGQADGVVHFRGSLSDLSPSQDLSNVQANMSLNGTVTGANQVLAEGVLFGGNTGVSAQQVIYTANGGTIFDQNIGNWYNGIQSFTSGPGQTIQSTLFAGLTLKNCNSAAQFVPGIEVRSSSDLTLASTWDFTNGGSSYGSWDGFGPGFLTLRAAGNLTINQDLTDNPTVSNNSWGMTLVSGADFNSANPTAIVKQTGVFQQGVNDLTIASGVQVYSQSGPLILAAGGDLILNTVDTQTFYGIVPYSVATYSGPISVNTGHDLTIIGGAILSATGNISINVGGDLNLAFDDQDNLGSIVTTGTSSTGQYFTYWSGGGNIAINVKGNVNSQAIISDSADDEAWDSFNVVNGVSLGWSASYTSEFGSSVTQGLATMAGGNLTVYAGGSFNCQAGTFSPYAYTWSNQTLISSVPMNDPGNLTIFSGSDMQGRFLVTYGIGELHSMGNFGTADLPPALELFNAVVNVSAQGDINIGAIINPTIARPSYGNNAGYWDLEYAPHTSVSLTSATGSVTLYGEDAYYPSSASNLTILPATVAIAAGGDIDILNDFSLAPYSHGNLSLVAGGDINGQLPGSTPANPLNAQILMSDQPDALPGQPNNLVYGPQAVSVTLTGGAQYSPVPDDPAGILHAGDTAPVVVSAGGDISNLMFFLSKAAQITAGGDINNIYYQGYNCNSTDVTKIRAAGNILFSYIPNYSNPGANTDTGILVGGPGALVVEAGNSINLGTSAGIQVVGNLYDASQLPNAAATLVVAAGYSKDFSNTASDAQFFTSLQSDGVDYSKDLAAGNIAQAQQIVAGARTKVISPFFAGSATTGSGDIDMTFSQITTTTSGVFIFTNGNLNVGGTAFTTAALLQSTGIITSEGGAINIFANKNVNVNEARVMTYLGGDITAWSDTGSINAGRGSKTAVDTSPPALTYDPFTGEYTITFSQPSVGSGIRTLTYNPDPEAGLEAPLEGNVYLFAPQGDINAGEAGIAGRNVILGAVQVLNANNIVFSQGEIGVPTSATGLSGLAALFGTGSITQQMQTVQATVTSADANSKPSETLSIAESFTVPSVDVKALSVFDIEPDDGTWEKTDNLQ
jgi:hypothetical protein